MARDNMLLKLQVSRETYDEIRRKLERLGYDRSFRDGLLYMSGIALQGEEPPPAEDTFSVRTEGKSVNVGLDELGGLRRMGLLAPCHLLPLLEIWALARLEDCHQLLDTAERGGTAIDELKRWGLIEHDCRKPPAEYIPHGWQVTDKGRTYIEALLATPLPVQKWVMP